MSYEEENLKNRTIITKDIPVEFEVYEREGIKMIRVNVPGFGEKTSHLGDSSEETMTRILADELILSKVGQNEK